MKPEPVPGPDGTTQAPHLAVSVFARGLLDRVVTRVYFADEAAANAADPVLGSSTPTGAATLIAAARPTTATASTSGCRERVRPFSSPSEPTGRLFDGVLAAGRGPRPRSPTGRGCGRMLEVEAALARAQATAGLMPAPAAAQAIVDACARVAQSTWRSSAPRPPASGNPVVPLVRRLRAAVDPADAPYVHFGATSQDILDTAGMLVARRALGPLLADLAAAADAAAGLAAAHRDTPMAGRTLLQQAVPTTFGLKAAGWMVGLDEAVARLADGPGTGWPSSSAARPAPWPVSAAPGSRSAAGLAAELGLAEPVLPWHTDRTRPAELAGALGQAAGVVGQGRPGRDAAGPERGRRGQRGRAGRLVGHGAQAEPGRGGQRAGRGGPGARAWSPRCSAAMAHEHERAAGAWHAEWRPLRELLVATGSAAPGCAPA